MLRGAAAAVVKNMSASLDVPTATSVRAIPAKAMIDNRIVINNHLKRTRGGKISFTHLLGYAIVQAVKKFPNMNRHFAEIDGKPNGGHPRPHEPRSGDRPGGQETAGNSWWPAIKNCETMRFGQFIAAYEDIVRRARDGKLTAEDFAGVTISLTNPGTIGTVHSVPRLMQGQGAIVGAGAMEYPAEFQGASEERINEVGIGKLMTLTSTYDHRIIQGAESGDFLRTIHQLLLDDDFYDEIFRELGIPYEPVRWRIDNPDSIEDKNARVIELIAAYRNRGHLMADIDPLRLDNTRFRSHPDLDVNTHGLTLWDLDREFKVNGFAGQTHKKLRDILGLLRDAYCRHVGVEYTHILEPEQQQWLQDRIEVKHEKPTVAEQKYILSKLNAAEAFETFLQTKYVGQKRFSLEGAETVIPMMDAAIDQAAEHALDEVVIGMPHRGRLNVLANIVGKPYSQIFTEFEGNLNPSQAHGSGDVKYHLGAGGTYIQMFGENDISVSLVANPSHLEAVDPVLEGIVRAKQDLLDVGEEADGSNQFTVVPMMLHGDAAFAGQGVVAETLNLALLRGYRTGGTIHIIVNNQIGFTTSPGDSRSSEYCTDVAKMIGAPIFHVNGDDPEAARVGGQAGRGLPAEVQEGRRHRHAVLPQARPQRGRRPVDDAAEHVRRHRHQAGRAQDLHRGVDRPRRHLDEGGRGRAARLPGPTRAGVQRGPRTGEARDRAEPFGGGRPDGARRHEHRGGEVAAGSASATRTWPSARTSACIRASSRCWRSAGRWPTRARWTGRSASCWRSGRSWPRARPSG